MGTPTAVRGTRFFPCATALILILLIGQTSADRHVDMANKDTFSQKLAEFGTKLFDQLASAQPNSNIIFSPFSIQTCLGMVRIGATDGTAEELDRALGFSLNTDVDTIAGTFNSILDTYKDSKILKTANKIYVSNGFEMKTSYNEILTKKFFSSAETINFREAEAAAAAMNNWVESKTNNLIKNLISSDALSADTRAVLINAIHFKGEWQHQFPKAATAPEHFYLNEKDKVQVPMMNLKERFLYGELPELDATALEMPYRDSDLSMLVILPNSRTGLQALQEKLRSVSLSDITKKMSKQKVIVKFPKFKAEFSIELSATLEKMGLARMFSDRAELGNILSSGSGLKVSQVVHKAFIEVNEEGTEAAAATECAEVLRGEFNALVSFARTMVDQVKLEEATNCMLVLNVMRISLYRRPRFFAVRPFVYMLRSHEHGIFFMGQLTHPN